MSPSDKNKATSSSSSGEDQNRECSKKHTMDSLSELPSSSSSSSLLSSSSSLTSSSSSDVTIPGHGTITNIPSITASLPTLKCSINDQMKTFDPGEDGGIKRLNSNHLGNSLFPGISSSSLMKNGNKNYKAGSKINKLADMLAKRSQNVVEVTQNNSSNIISDITTSVLKVDDTVILNNVCSSNNKNFDTSLDSPVACFEKTAEGKELDIIRKSRRKSVPNQSCNLHQLQLQSTSKSCSDFSKLFPTEENGKSELNALGGSLIMLQTDESTKKKAIRKNLKNVELSLILPEKKRRSSMRNENLVSSKVIEKVVYVTSEESKERTEGTGKSLESPKEIITSSISNPIRSVSSTKIKKEGRGKQRKSKRLVETSTQTADIEFVSVIKPKVEEEKPAPIVTAAVVENEKPTVTYECLYCTQTFALGSQCKAHEKVHSQKNNKQFIKCQYCSKKFSSLGELKSHCVKKHSNKYSYCAMCDERFTTKEELQSHNKEVHQGISGDGFHQDFAEEPTIIIQEKNTEEIEEKQSEKKACKQNNSKTDLKIDVSYDSSKKSSISPRNIQKTSPKENKTEEQLLEMEMLFYSHLSGNIQENLTNHLDGKIDKFGNPVRTDYINELSDGGLAKTKSSNLLSVITPNMGVPDVQMSRAPSPYQTRSKTPNPLPPTAKKFKKLPNWQQKFWEKYNFPTNYRYEHRFWDKNYLNTEKSAFYLKDLSCLDIKTQLTMRENIKKLDEIKTMEEMETKNYGGFPPENEKFTFPDYLSLVPRDNVGNNHENGKTDSQRNVSELGKGRKNLRKDKEDNGKKSFKSPGLELPMAKSRRKLSSDNSSSGKKQPDKTNTEGLKMMTRRQSSIDLMKDVKEESFRRRKGSLDMSTAQGVTLRRQSSLDNLQGINGSKIEKNDVSSDISVCGTETDSSPLSPAGSAEISGEWVRPRSYLCGTCCTKFTNLWELEDHKWVSHPNVWCTHYEFEDEKIEKLFQNTEEEGKEATPSSDSPVLSKLKLTDLYKRYLLPHGSLKTAKLVPHTNFPEQCTKCKKHCMNSSEMHKHMLDCGGDTTWFLTMYSSPMSIKRKWRPFGSRRRKQIGRRDIKRNIPSTPTLRSYHYQHRIRTKPGDVESIQKMLANLPEKRARRAINFDEIKTRSQATIYSNRLLRKRFKASFANNFLKLKNLKQKQRPLKGGSSKGSSKSTTDASSESTPTGSPKRKNKLKESFVKEENSREGFSEASGSSDGRTSKKRAQSKKKEATQVVQTKTETVSKRKTKNEAQVSKKEKATVKRKAKGTTGKVNKKSPAIKEETSSNISSEGMDETIDSQTPNKKLKESSKLSRSTKKKGSYSALEQFIKEEPKDADSETSTSISEIVEEKKSTPKKSSKSKSKPIKAEEVLVEDSGKDKDKDQLANIQCNSILRLKQKNKDKTELLKRIKKKVKNSKRILELKKGKKVPKGKRRSQRIKSLRLSEDGFEISTEKKWTGEAMKEEFDIVQKDIILKKAIVSLESGLVKKAMRASVTRSPKSIDDEEIKEPLEDNPGRKSQRAVRNFASVEEKQEIMVTNDSSENPDKKLSVLRRNSKSIYEINKPPTPEVFEDPVTPKKSSRIQNIRNSLVETKPDMALINVQMSSQKKSLRLPKSATNLEDSLDTDKSDGSSSKDLEEMPILAKVEPIHGKIFTKNESEIPVLMPFEKEPDEENDSEEEKPRKGQDMVSFKVIMKRRKTSKEVTPLKIVKNVETVPMENEIEVSGSFASEDMESLDEAPVDSVKSRKRKSTFAYPEDGDNDFNGSYSTEGSSYSSLNDLPVTGKNRKRKSDIPPSEKKKDLTEKRTKNSKIKKYFLGICPSEIDKGKKDGQEESGSDSEPLISLIVNQAQKEIAQLPVEIDNKNMKMPDVVEKENEEKASTPKLDSPKRIKPKKKKKVMENITAVNPILPNLIITPCKIEEKFDNLIIPIEKIQVEKANFEKPIKLGKKMKVQKNKKKVTSKPLNRLKMTVTLKEPTLKIIDRSPGLPNENKWSLKASEQNTEVKPTKECSESLEKAKEEILENIMESVLPERRSRRVSKETKSSNEFIIDDPLILVDELWSDLDSDSDSSKKKSRKGKKKTQKKKTNEDKRVCDVNLEELLRNFGEKKEVVSVKKEEPPPANSASMTIKIVKRGNVRRSFSDLRKCIENRIEKTSYKRLSLKLFRFNKQRYNFGTRGTKLKDAKKAVRQKQYEIQTNYLPDLPFLAAEIKENPVQVIQCRAQKPKSAKKGQKRNDSKSHSTNIQLKISLPLESINNIAVFNNNHLTELVVEELGQVEEVPVEVPPPPSPHPPEEEETPVEVVSENENPQKPEEPTEVVEPKNKAKRSEVIDKIFYCEICQTYYYSSSQLKIHKLSNRHKLKEAELLLAQKAPEEEVEIIEDNEVKKEEPKPSTAEVVAAVEEPPVQPESSKFENIEAEKLNDDTLEMPTLEGPFIENPLGRLAIEAIEPTPQPPVVNTFGFSQESLKDIQRAIGCTDEEMLLLTLLGENTIEIENDILDLDTCKSTQQKTGNVSGDKKTENTVKETEKANGSITVDLKQRMTSALACLVNKAVSNLLQKYKTTTKSAVNPEALTFLGKLSNLSRRKNILQLNELLKKQSDGETSIGSMPKEFEKKEPTVPYKYQCTICGSRFEKASTREFHISRSHKGKAKKVEEEVQMSQVPADDDWNDSWMYDTGDDHLGTSNTSQFWCSDCGINFLSPQEVMEHQRIEHQTGLKETERTKDTGPLQSSTIGSSDEIIDGKKGRRRPKLFSSEELDQQRIIANNELRKLDRKFSVKNKTNKIKWGMDALKFTVEKENKMVAVEGEKEISVEDSQKPQMDVKNIDLVPKLNLSRTNNIPEFKVIQKNTLKNRFQKIIDNKLKRRTTRHSQQETENEEVETEVMLVPVVVKKKNKKPKQNKCLAKKDEGDKVVDVYDFNESESEGEPAVFSHIKKPTPSPTKLKLVKAKEGPSKNKADSTTKDLAPDDYDSEDSLPLAIVKKSKPGEEDEEKDEKISEDGMEKSEGILEQVEYLIEQLEHETGSSGKKEDAKDEEEKEEKEEEHTAPKENKTKEYSKEETSTKEDSVDSAHESFRISLANEFLELENIPLKNPKMHKNEDSVDAPVVEEERVEEPTEQEDSILAEPETSQSTFDDEDSMPLVLISRKADVSKPKEDDKKCDENTTDVSTTASEDVQMFRPEKNKPNEDVSDSPANPQTVVEESLPLLSSPGENDTGGSEKSDKPFETLNGNVIYCRNDSMSEFGSDISNDGLIDSNFEKINPDGTDKDFIKEVTEKEDVVIVCSKRDDESSNEDKPVRKRLKLTQNKKKESVETVRKKKKRLPLLTATIEENNFRKSQSPKLNKEVIVRKIWSRRKITEDSTDNDDDYFGGLDNDNYMEDITNEESQTGVEKEIIVKKIWNRKKVDQDGELIEKGEEVFEDVKINQTEISDEVVIKCGPKPRTSLKRRKSKSSNESSKETIMRKIWSGKCTFQTKAALKTYDSDMILNCKENEVAEIETRPKKRGRPAGFSTNKRNKVEIDIDKDDEDDLDSLLEEIEREQLEKAIRSEFLQLRRSEKANVEIMKEGSNPTVGLFTESSLKHKKEISDRKRRKVRRNIKHPRQSNVLKRRKFVKKPIKRIVQSDERTFNEGVNRANSEPEQSKDNCPDNKMAESPFDGETKMKNRKHKKHRHKHHHHKHKHKKSKHHKSIVGKHKSKHKFEVGNVVGGGGLGLDNSDSFTILEKICQDIPNQIESEMQFKTKTCKKRINSELNNIDSKIEDILMCPFSFENKAKDCNEVGYDDEVSGKERFETGNGNIYEFVEDVPDFATDGYKKSQNVNY